MHRRLHILILTALILAALPGRADEVAVTTLSSGLKVIVRESRAVNLAAVDIWVRAGSASETAETCGTAHFIEHMIFKATDRYGPGQIDREIEGLGADLNGGTTKDWIHFYTTVPSADLPTALNAVADAIARPKFDAAEMEKERRVILDEIARYEADPMKRAGDTLAALLFPNHPYGRPQAGTRDTIARLTRDDLVSFYTANFTPANTVVVIAGDVSKADAAAMVEKAFEGYGDRPSHVVAAAPSRPDADDGRDGADADAPLAKRLPSATAQAYVAVGFRVPGVAEFKDTCTLDAARIIFGETPHGRIADALTKAGIKFSKISTDYITTREPSVFSVTAAVEPAAADRTVQAIVDEFRRLAQSGVTEGEISYARRRIEGSDLFAQETFAGQARSLGFYESIASYTLAVEYVPTVRAVTRDDVSTLARKHFSTEGYASVILSPEVKE